MGDYEIVAKMLADLAAERDALRTAARTWYGPGGVPEILATAEEVVERRKAAAQGLDALRAEVERLRSALAWIAGHSDDAMAQAKTLHYDMAGVARSALKGGERG